MKQMTAGPVTGPSLDRRPVRASQTGAGPVSVPRSVRSLILWHALPVKSPRSSSASSLWKSLHWLPVRQCVIYKTALITYKALKTGQPVYLHDLLSLSSTSSYSEILQSTTQSASGKDQLSIQGFQHRCTNCLELSSVFIY